MSCAIRLVMAPDLKAVSRAAVSSTKSATSPVNVDPVRHRERVDDLDEDAGVERQWH